MTILQFPRNEEVVKTELIYDNGNYAIGLGKDKFGNDIIVVAKRGRLEDTLFYNLTEDMDRDPLAE